MKIIDRVGWMCVSDNPWVVVVGANLALLIVIGGAAAYFAVLCGVFYLVGGIK